MIKKQIKDEKHPYESPTTYGLFVTMRNYIIELVCLNVDSKIGPRFWSDQSYWGPKYRREIRGVSNLSKELDLTDPLTQTALVKVIKEYNIKALVAKKTITKVIKLTNRRITQLKEQRSQLISTVRHKDIDNTANSIFVDTDKPNVLSKIRKSESHRPQD